MIGCRLSHGLGPQRSQRGEPYACAQGGDPVAQIRTRAGMEHHDVCSRRLARTQGRTQTSESFPLVSVCPQASDVTGRRDGGLPRGHLGLHRATCQACCAIGMGFDIVCICQASLTVLSYPYIGEGHIYWDLAAMASLGCYVTYDAPNSQSEGPRCCSWTVSASNSSPCRCCGNFTASHWICMLSCYLMVYPLLPRRTCTSNAHYATTLDTMQVATDRLSVLTLPLQEGIYRSLLLPANERRWRDGRGHGRHLRLTIPVNPSFHLLLIREGCFTARHRSFDGSIQASGNLRGLCRFCVCHINIFSAQAWPCSLAAGFRRRTLLGVCNAILEAVCDALHLRALDGLRLDGRLGPCRLLYAFCRNVRASGHR